MTRIHKQYYSLRSTLLVIEKLQQVIWTVIWTAGSNIICTTTQSTHCQTKFMQIICMSLVLAATIDRVVVRFTFFFWCGNWSYLYMSDPSWKLWMFFWHDCMLKCWTWLTKIVPMLSQVFSRRLIWCNIHLFSIICHSPFTSFVWLAMFTNFCEPLHQNDVHNLFYYMI
jgi:hypothetical protein